MSRICKGPVTSRRKWEKYTYKCKVDVNINMTTFLLISYVLICGAVYSNSNDQSGLDSDTNTKCLSHKCMFSLKTSLW